MVTRNGRPRRLEEVTLYSERHDVDVRVRVEVEDDGAAYVDEVRMAEGGGLLAPDSLSEDDDRRARELATTEE